MKRCDECGKKGNIVDTSAGEICKAGEVVEVRQPPYLLAGKADGSRPDEVFCEDCVEGYHV